MIKEDISLTKTYSKKEIAKASINFYPPSIQNDLLQDAALRSQLDVKVNAKVILDFSDGKATFHRATLYDQLRKVVSDGMEGKIKDANGEEWSIERNDLDSPTAFLMQSKNGRVLLNYIPEISSLKNVRLEALKSKADKFFLSETRNTFWKAILTKRPLSDEELEAYEEEFKNTPVGMTDSIAAQVKGSSTVESLVPASINYYERLIGAHNESVNIDDYMANEGHAFLSELTAWKPYEGFLFSLYMSWHISVHDKFSVEQLTLAELKSAYDYLVHKGDPASQLGALELGFKLLPGIPDIDSNLVALTEGIATEESITTRYKLLSALFILVDGELSRTKVFDGKPAFYRRLASLSHASLIFRQCTTLNVLPSFVQWALEARLEEFYWQTFADMRTDPRWIPDFANEESLFADFMGRLLLSAKMYEPNIAGKTLFDIILSDCGLIHSKQLSYKAYYPGPLEGGSESKILPPETLMAEINKQLTDDKASCKSFIALSNSALVFKIEDDVAALASGLIQLSQYRLRDVDSVEQLRGIMTGLAIVSSVTRNRDLANSVRTMVRTYMNREGINLSVLDAMQICAIAAASINDLVEWSQFIGDWFYELSFCKPDSQEGLVALFSLRVLCNAEPYLWIYCSRAEAAFEAAAGNLVN